MNGMNLATIGVSSHCSYVWHLIIQIKFRSSFVREEAFTTLHSHKRTSIEAALPMKESYRLYLQVSDKCTCRFDNMKTSWALDLEQHSYHLNSLPLSFSSLALLFYFFIHFNLFCSSQTESWSNGVTEYKVVRQM